MMGESHEVFTSAELLAAMPVMCSKKINIKMDM